MRDIHSTVRTTEAIGDFFEFFELYLIGQGLREELLSFVANTVRVARGTEDVDKAIQYETTIREQRRDRQQGDTPEETTVLMIYEEPDGQPTSFSPEDAPEDLTIECYICGTLHAVERETHVECHICAKPVCVSCCQPIYQDECKNCQVAQFLQWRAQEATTIGQETGIEHGNELSQERGNAPQGVTGHNLEARLASLAMISSEMPTSQTDVAWAMRQRQADAYRNTSLGPPDLQHHDEWRPPYEHYQTYPNQLPAIFSHPYYNQTDATHLEAPMDPPIAPEAVSALTGIPLQIPVYANNRYVKEQTDLIHSTASHRNGDNARNPIPAYHPASSMNQTERIGIHIDDRDQRGFSTSNRMFLTDLESIHQTMQASMQRTYDRLPKGRGRGKEQHAVTRYDGTDTQCSICQHPFTRGEPVTRLKCNHLFHEQCWDGLLQASTSDDDCECPNCRGPPIAKAIFRFIGHERPTGPRGIGRNRRNDSSSERSYQSTASVPTTSVFMMQNEFLTAEQLAVYQNSWTTLTPEEFFSSSDAGKPASSDASDEQLATTVHLKASSKTKLPGGRSSLLVDLGSRINIIGKNTEKEFAEASTAHGLKPTYVQKPKRLLVNGVGSDSAFCDNEVIAPIAVKYEDRDAIKESYRANIAEGCGENLPAIYGSDSMIDKDAVIILRKGKQMIVFPGPGGYKIEWSPGSRLLPMIPAPSGHLVIPCDKFDDLDSVKGTSESITFWTDHLNME